MNKKQKFEKLCRYIWQDNPHELIAVRVNPETDEDGLGTYLFAAPDNHEISGRISISENGLVALAKGLGYASARIVKQRGTRGWFVIPDPDLIERDKLLDS